MVTTKKVVTAIAGAISVQCSLAGLAVAAELQELTGGESVETILAAVSALCIGIIGTTLAGVRWIVKAAKQEEHQHSQNPLWLLFANQLTRDTDALDLLKDIVHKLDEHDNQLKDVVAEYHLRKAQKETGRPWEGST